MLTWIFVWFILEAQQLTWQVEPDIEILSKVKSDGTLISPVETFITRVILSKSVNPVGIPEISLPCYII